MCLRSHSQKQFHQHAGRMLRWPIGRVSVSMLEMSFHIHTHLPISPRRDLAPIRSFSTCCALVRLLFGVKKEMFSLLVCLRFWLIVSQHSQSKQNLEATCSQYCFKPPDEGTPLPGTINSNWRNTWYMKIGNTSPHYPKNIKQWDESYSINRQTKRKKQ